MVPGPVSVEFGDDLALASYCFQVGVVRIVLVSLVVMHALMSVVYVTMTQPTIAYKTAEVSSEATHKTAET